MRRTGAHTKFWWRAADAPSHVPPLPHPSTTLRAIPPPLVPVRRATIELHFEPDLDPIQQTLRMRPRRRNSRFIATSAAGLFGATIVAFLGVFGGSVRMAEPLHRQIDRLLVTAGLAIHEVSLSGHRYTGDNEIYAALALDGAGSLISYDVTAARERIESLSWIKSASISRVMPDKLAVRVMERQPAAIWLHNGKSALIDSSGRVLAYVAGAGQLHLPRLSGAGAPAAAGALLAALQPHSAILARLEVAQRIGERRWTLQLASGLRVHLPSDRVGEALLRLARAQDSSRALDETASAIDLRKDGVITIAPRVHAAVPVAPQRAASAL